MISYKDGHYYPERPSEEAARLLQQDVERLSPEEKETLKVVMEELKTGGKPGTPTLLQTMHRLEWQRDPVDMRTFVMDEYYLGKTCDTIYPKVLEDLETIFDGSYSEAVITGAIGAGKCNTGETSITDLESGVRAPIRDWVGKRPLVASLAPNNRIEAARANKVWESGRKHCLRMVLSSGHSLGASDDHPVLCPDGYRRLDELKVGDLVACARRLPRPVRPLVVSDAEVVTAAYLIADGSLTHTSHLYIKGSRDLVDDFKAHVESVPGFRGFGREKFHKGAWYVSFLGLESWTRDLGIRCLSKEKRVPPRYFGLGDRQLALFLNRLFTDGSVLTKGKSAKVELQLASEGLIDDVQELLRRFGVFSRKRYSPKRAKKGGKLHPSWRLDVAAASDVLAFFRAVGPIKGGEAKSERAVELASAVRSNTNVDIVPITYEDIKDIRQETGPHEKKWWGRVAGLTPRSYMGRDRFVRLCDLIGYKGRLRRFAEMDVIWERVKSLTPLGVLPVYDLEVPATKNAVVNGGIIVHNTFSASIGICRILYELSCMVSPHRSFGLASDSTLAVVCFSANEYLAKKVAFENIATKIKASPYFKEHFPFRATQKELRFPNGVLVAARATTDTGALGFNVVGAFIDEASFMPQPRKKANQLEKTDHDQASVIYYSMKRRMKSRFSRRGKLPGCIFIVSSKQTTDDFVSRRIKEAENESDVFVSDRSLWDVKPEAYFSSTRFFVLVGNEQTPSKIVEDPEEVARLQRELPEGCILAKIPEDFRKDFESNLESSIRDIAGIATVSVAPYIQRREKILAMIDNTRAHPFSVASYDPGLKAGFLWSKLVKSRKEKDGPRGWVEMVRPIVSPDALRVIHLDPATKMDSYGMCLAHICGWTEVERRSPDMETTFRERAPLYWVDLILRLIPPAGGEVELADARRLIYDLSEHGYTITKITADIAQSVDSLQILRSKGYATEHLSVDRKMDAYDNLKQALYEGRVNCYPFPALVDELIHLQIDHKKRKVDHPPGKSKDLADALAGALFSLSQQAKNHPVPIYQARPDDSWTEQARLAANTSSPQKVEDMLPPFLLGG